MTGDPLGDFLSEIPPPIETGLKTPPSHTARWEPEPSERDTSVLLPGASVDGLNRPGAGEETGERAIVLLNVHDPAACEGRACVIHHPSDHHMRTWPAVWRNDRRMVERTCEHGIGHPDPDDLAYRLTQPGPVGERDSGVHGCDGCCTTSLTLEEACIQVQDAIEEAMAPLWRIDMPLGILQRGLDRINDDGAPHPIDPRPWWARLLRRTA